MLSKNCFRGGRGDWLQYCSHVVAEARRFSRWVGGQGDVCYRWAVGMGSILHLCGREWSRLGLEAESLNHILSGRVKHHKHHSYIARVPFSSTKDHDILTSTKSVNDVFVKVVFAHLCTHAHACRQKSSLLCCYNFLSKPNKTCDSVCASTTA